MAFTNREEGWNDESTIKIEKTAEALLHEVQSLHKSGRRSGAVVLIANESEDKKGDSNVHVGIVGSEDMVILGLMALLRETPEFVLKALHRIQEEKFMEDLKKESNQESEKEE